MSCSSANWWLPGTGKDVLLGVNAGAEGESSVCDVETLAGSETLRKPEKPLGTAIVVGGARAGGFGKIVGTTVRGAGGGAAENSKTGARGGAMARGEDRFGEKAWRTGSGV